MTDIATGVTAHPVVTIVAGFLPVLVKAFSNETIKLPIWATKWRLALVAALSLLATGFDQATNGVDLKSALTALAISAGPAVAMEILHAIFGGNDTGGGKESDSGPSNAPESGRPYVNGPIVQMRSLALACVLIVAVPGCATFKAISPVLSDVIVAVQDGSALIDAIRGAAAVFFLQHRDPVAQEKVEKALSDATLALDVALRATRGAKDLTADEADAGFDEFRKAYGSLVTLLKELGIAEASPSGKLAVRRGSEIRVVEPLALGRVSVAR